MTEVEVAAGHPLDLAAASPPPASAAEGADTDRLTARQALELELVELLADGRPLFVSFSGGRDSSALLALAVHISRLRGLARPIPLVQRFEHPSTAEDERFQDLLLEQLDLEAVIVRAPRGDDEVLGPASTEGLRRVGLTWPWRLHTMATILGAARGGILVDGEGGDDVFGPTPTRVLHHLRQVRRHPVDLLRQVALDLGPDGVRRRLAGRPLPEMTYFTDAGRREVWQRSAEQFAVRPRPAGAAIRAFAASRPVRVGHATLDRHCAAHEVERVSPLLRPRFIESLAREAGVWGWRDRTSAMARIFADVLPQAVLRRSSKVDFTDVVWGESSRGWLESWDRRSGVNRRWVDADQLAAHWAAGHPMPGTALMAQAAWLEQEVGRSAVA